MPKRKRIPTTGGTPATQIMEGMPGDAKTWIMRPITEGNIRRITRLGPVGDLGPEEEVTGAVHSGTISTISVETEKGEGMVSAEMEGEDFSAEVFQAEALSDQVHLVGEEARQEEVHPEAARRAGAPEDRPTPTEGAEDTEVEDLQTGLARKTGTAVFSDPIRSRKTTITMSVGAEDGTPWCIDPGRIGYLARPHPGSMERASPSRAS